jgi:hypothetical protein
MKAAGKTRTSIAITATALCAGLYAIGSYLTAYIPSPWGFGQFRPAVVIPSLFAVIFGPVPSGVGAALGTLIADSVKHGYIYEGSLIAAVPGNFIGFYLFGYIMKRFTWGRFILASNLTLTVANLIVATLYVFIFKVLYLGQLALQFNALLFLVIGLTIWWFVTMLPFVLLVTPPLIRVVAHAFPAIVPEDVKTHSLQEEMPKRTFSLALLLPGLIMLLMGIATSYTAFGEFLLNLFGALTKELIQLMFYGSGFIMLVLGVSVLVTRK